MIAPALSDTREKSWAPLDELMYAMQAEDTFNHENPGLWLRHNISEKEQASLSKMIFILSSN